MGACLSKKKGSSKPPPQKQNSRNGVTVTLSKDPEITLKNNNNTVQEKQKQQEEPEVIKEDEGQVKKEIFIIKHRKSHDDRERNSKIQTSIPSDEIASPEPESINKVSVPVAPSTPNIGVRTSSCTKEEVDAILIQCGRLSRSSSGKAASSSAVKKYSGSKRSFDFDHDNDAISAEDDQKRVNGSDNSDEYDGVAVDNRRHHHQHRQRNRQSPRPSSSRRRTPSRERDQQQQQQQRSSSRERRVSRSPGRRTSETNTSISSNTGSSSRPGKLVTVPALVMDKSNNGESVVVTTGVKRGTVKKNVGESGMVGSRGVASPRSQSPARAKSPARVKSPARGNGNAANGKVEQPSLSRNNSARKAEQSPYRRNPLSEVDPNSLAYPQSNTNNGGNKVQGKSKKEIEVEAIQKPNVVKGVSVNCHTKEQQEEEIKVMSSVPDNVVVKTMVMPSGVDNNLKPQTITRSRSSRRSRDLDINPESLMNPPLSYTSLLLEDIQNFHQKNTQQPSVSLPACLTKACSILEAVSDLNSTTSSKEQHPFVESEVAVSDDVMEPSLHKYVTVKRGGSLDGIDMEDQESSGSNSFTVSSGQQHWGISSSSWEPNSADSSDCWSSRLNSREESQKSGLGLEGSFSSEANKKVLNSKKRECDHQHSGGIGRGRLGSNKGLHSLPVAAAST